MAEQEGRLAVDEAGHEIYYRLFGEGPGDARRAPRRARRRPPVSCAARRARRGRPPGAPVRPARKRQVRRPGRPFAVGRAALRRGARDAFGRASSSAGCISSASPGAASSPSSTRSTIPTGVKSLVLSNTGSSTAEIFRGMTQLRLDLGADVVHADGRCTRRRATSRALSTRRSSCSSTHGISAARRRSRSSARSRSSRRSWRRSWTLGPAYFEMWGPHEFLLTGTLADWDVTDRLGEIEVPALIVCGWYDECDLAATGSSPTGSRTTSSSSSATRATARSSRRRATPTSPSIKDFVRRASA